MSCGCSECNKKYGGIPRPPLSYKAGGKSPKASMSCGQVKRSTRPGKKIMKLYCIDGKKKLVHAGAKGYGHNYSAAARKSFKARHKCSTAKPGTAKHLACTELWAGKGGSKKSSPKGRKGKYAVGGPYLNINPYNPLNESDFDVLYKNKGQGEMDLSGRQQRRIARRQTGRNIGAASYGVLEGLVDTVTFGATDKLTDKGYEALAGLGREQSAARRAQSDRYRVGGQGVGATAGAILTGGAATGSAIGTTDFGTLANEGPQALQTGLNVAGTVAGVAAGNTSGLEGTGGALGGTAVGDVSAKLGQSSSFGGTGTGFENLAQTYAPNLKEGISSFQDFKELNEGSNLGDFLKENPEMLQKVLEGLGMGSGAQANKYGGPISFRAGGRRYSHGGYHPPTNLATRADSLAVYTGAINLEEALKSSGYTRSGDRQEWLRDVPDKILESPSRDDFSGDIEGFNYGLLKQEDGTFKVNPNFDPDLENIVLMGTAGARARSSMSPSESDLVPKGYSSLRRIDDYKYDVSELFAHYGYNTDLPYGILDERIAPQGMAIYTLDPEKEKGWDTASMLYYDPIAVAPIDQLTEDEIRERVNRYGNSGVPIRYQDPNKPGYGVQSSQSSPTAAGSSNVTIPSVTISSTTTKPPSRPRIDIEPMQPITPGNYSTETPSLNVNLNRPETDRLIDTQDIYRTPLFNKNNIRGRKRPLTQVGERRVYERPDGTRYTAVDRFDREMIRDLKKLRNPKRRRTKASFQTGGPTDPPKDGVLHMGNAADYFNSTAIISDNPRANALIRQKVYAGTHGYNPQTGALVKLDTPVKVDPATQAMATEEYTRATAGTRGGITDAKTDAYLESLPEDQRQAVEDRFQEQRRQGVERELGKMYQNPITYAPAAIYTAGLAGPAMGALGTAGRSALTAPLTVGSRTIPYVTAGDAIGAGFATRGAYNLGTDLDSGFYSDLSIPASQKVERGVITGLDLLGTPGMGSAFYQTGRGAINLGRRGLDATQRAATAINRSTLKGQPTLGVSMYVDDAGNITSKDIIDYSGKTITGHMGQLVQAVPPRLREAGRYAQNIIPNVQRAAVDARFTLTQPTASPGFKSEINWANWNKNTPKYPGLIKEYNAIEEATKKAGTWMKNPDGTPFQGPPELFIHTQSRHFKKAFPEGYNIVYRGTAGRNTTPTTTSFDKETGKVSSALFSADENLARSYAHAFGKGDIPFITPEMAYSGEYPMGVFKLAVPKVGNKNLSFPANRDSWTEVALAGKNRATLEAALAQQKSMYNRMLKNPEFAKDYSFGSPLAQKQQQIAELEAALSNPQGIVSNVPEFQKMRGVLGDVTTTDRIAEYLETTNLPSIQLRNVNDGGLGDVTIINRAPGMYPKSLIGNVGFYNMRNPDVFGAAIPAVGGAAGYGLLQNSELGEFKSGGYQGGLRRWFKEKWVDVKTGKPCGRSGKEKTKRAYPYCRPSRKVSSKTPATSKHSKAKSRARQKTGPGRVKPISQRKKK